MYAVPLVPEADHHKVHRVLMLAGGIIYPLWWVLFSFLDFIPEKFYERVLVGMIILGLAWLSRSSAWFIRNTYALYLFGSYLIQIHYFWALERSNANVTYIIGQLIISFALSMTFVTPLSLITYGIFSMVGVTLVNLDGLHIATFYPPASIATVILVAYIVMAQRNRLHAEERRSRLEIERQRAALATSAKMSALGEMAGGIAHEINNPLAVIQGLAQRTKIEAQEHEISQATLLQRVDTVETMVERIVAIIRGLRAFARDADHDPFEAASLNRIIEDATSLCAQRFKSHGVKFEIDIPFKDLSIECRPTQISQVIVNLLSNAYDATKLREDRHIRLAAIDAGGEVRIEVSDNGMGIPNELHEKIMHPFFSTKASGDGTGLGLSISRGIAEGHHGRLTLAHSKPGLTIFVLTLPKYQPKK